MASADAAVPPPVGLGAYHAERRGPLLRLTVRHLDLAGAEQRQALALPRGADEGDALQRRIGVGDEHLRVFLEARRHRDEDQRAGELWTDPRHGVVDRRSHAGVARRVADGDAVHGPVDHVFVEPVHTPCQHVGEGGGAVDQSVDDVPVVPGQGHDLPGLHSHRGFPVDRELEARGEG